MDWYFINWQFAIGIMLVSAFLGLCWSLFNYLSVKKINIWENVESNTQEYQESISQLQLLSDLISNGAKDFLYEEYKFCLGFLALMAIVVYFAVDFFQQKTNYLPFVTISFLIGGLTSIVSGYICMAIAVKANYKVSFNAISDLSKAFRTAFSAGASMGFCLVSIALSILAILFVIYFSFISKNLVQNENIYILMESLSGYGLGGSTVALFGRVGGGIYTKAADVGADLVGKVQQNLPEDDARNPATIADNVGDNVGDVAGMGADLFGSFAESTCAALVVSGTTLLAEGQTLVDVNYLMFPMLITAVGIIVCIITSAVPLFIKKVRYNEQIEPTLKQQLVISTVLLTIAIGFLAYFSLPAKFSLQNLEDFQDRKPYHAFISVMVGLWAGLIIGFITEYYTSHSYTPVREVANSCRTGAATNVIYGLALGYLSTFIPVIAICIAAYVSHVCLSFYGVALAALGMLSNLPIGLTIDGYGPISDNAGGIAEMAKLPEIARERTDALDAAGNTTAAIGKGFAIGSAALVSLALYGGFITRWKNYNSLNQTNFKFSTEVTEPLVFMGMLFGAMLPYLFSAFTMKSVGQAAALMVNNINEQIEKFPGILDGTVKPDYTACIKISTQASLKEMIKPGLLVIVTPLLVGFLFGPQGVAGLLPGALISGIQMAISAANTGGAWDNAKKYIEAGNMRDANGNLLGKGSDLHKAAVIGDTVGDPLKDTSGPSLNILIKLMAILSLVFADFFCQTGYLLKINPKAGKQVKLMEQN